MSTVLKAPGAADRPPGLQRPRLDWRRLNPFHRRAAGGGGEGPSSTDDHRPWRPGWGSAALGVVVLAIVVFLMVFQWNWLRGPIGRYASAQTGREVRLLGDLKVHLFSWTPRADIGGLTIGNPTWGPKTNMAEVGQVSVSIRLAPLFRGQVILPLLSIQHPTVALLRDAQGRANWDLSDGRKGGKPFKLPPIQTFIVDQGRLTVRDIPRKLTFAGTVNASEERANAYDRGFRLTGKGELNRKAFVANVVGGPLLNVQPDRPYPFDASITAGATHVTAKGQVPKPFDLGVLNAAVSVEGRDLNALYDLTGLTLPNTPPYRVSGQLRRNGKVYYYDRFAGRIGASDINGDASVDVSHDRPFLKATLNSRLLDFADLAGVFGVPGASKAAAPEQKTQIRALKAEGRFLPDATLQTDRIRSMDAVVTYRADRVKTVLPLRSVFLGVKLDHGVLNLDPISIGFPTGKLTGTATLDARPKTPVTKVDLRIANLKLEQFVPPVSGSRPLSGDLMARARLTGTGDSAHKAAASSDGEVTVVIPRGQIRQAVAELMGIDATKGLFLLLSHDQTPTDVRCALADFKVTNGVMTAQTIVFDTDVVLVNGSGTINLSDERLDLTLKGQPKKFRAVRLIAPFTVDGVLRNPKFGIEPAGAIAQAGLGATLGALLSPLAAILPFVSPGLEKDANCAALFSQARQSYAPVPAPKAAPPPSGKAAGKG
ncbi:MAG TPA: AsmA family protein [Caulobacteraceae bacterium]|nr:AsmA family protein [Caulobacteraceae bacterium]